MACRASEVLNSLFIPFHLKHCCTDPVALLNVQYECEDVLRDSNLFEAVGVGIGKQEMYNVMLMVKKLGEDPKKGVATIRFFGKFWGLSADYFVFETTLKETPEEPEEVLGEAFIGVS